MKFSLLKFTPPQERTITLEITGTPQDFINLMDDLGNCYSEGTELRDALERAV